VVEKHTGKGSVLLEIKNKIIKTQWKINPPSVYSSQYHASCHMHTYNSDWHVMFEKNEMIQFLFAQFWCIQSFLY
jgi:hypothetical protein